MSAGKPEDTTVKFLLEEHKHLTESYWKNEEMGEKRFNFFLTLVTAAMAALVALATAKKTNLLLEQKYFLPITIGSVLALLLYGFATFLRLCRRNQVTDGYKMALKSIREHFKRWDNSALATYDPFPDLGKRKLWYAGLGVLTLIINSLLCGLLALLLGVARTLKTSPDASPRYAVAAFFVILSAVIQGIIFWRLGSLGPNRNKG